MSNTNFYSSLLATTGSSLATLLFGFASPPYYILMSASIFLLIPTISRLERGQWHAITAIAIPTFLVALSNSAYPADYELDSLQEFFRATILSVTLILATCAASLDPRRFQSLMAITATCHLIFFLPLLLVSDIAGGARFSVGGISVAATAEISLGMGFAALLSGSRILLVTALPVAFGVIALTQMRIAGVSLVSSIFVYAILHFLRKRASTLRILVILGLASGSFLLTIAFSDLILEYISRLLLLNDPHRGIESGFSGRLSNIFDALELAVERPVIGYGFQHDVINYAHNGYILTLGQLGFVFGGFLIIVALYSAWLAFFHRDPRESAVVLGYLIFLMGQPRNINLQLCVFIGVMCILRVIFAKQESIRRLRLESRKLCT